MAQSIERFLRKSLNPAYRLYKLRRRLRRIGQDLQYRRLPGETRNLESLFRNEKLIRLFADTSPRLHANYYQDYVSCRWSVDEVIHRIHDHYRFLLDRFPPAALEALSGNGISLWSTTHEDMNAEVRLLLLTHDTIRNEGEFQLTLFLNGTWSHALGFLYHAAPDGRHYPLVCRNQGCIGQFEQVRQFRKAHFELAPLFLLMDSLIALNTFIGLDEIQVLAPAESYQSRLGEERLDALYRQAFEPFHARVRTEDGRAAIHLPLEEKPLESIDRRHRKRTQQKRQAREQMRTEVLQRLEALSRPAEARHEDAPLLAA
ncbi:DUF535 family protein [Zoogloea sp.]|uniref:DUF535 family protein n=1 Tax=Zoogloea sp. TaxID=49181 RepID=UPI0035AEC457